MGGGVPGQGLVRYSFRESQGFWNGSAFLYRSTFERDSIDPSFFPVGGFPSLSYENYSKWSLMESPMNAPSPPPESFRDSSHPRTSPHTIIPHHQMVCGRVTTGLLDSLLFHWDEVSQKPHSQIQAEPVLPRVASRTGSQFLVIAELVNRNLTVLREFSRPHLISQFQRGNMRDKLSLHKYCCKVKRKIINVERASPVPFHMPRILNLSSQCNHLVLVYFIWIK